MTHLANLLIAGVPKAGTTSLFAYLAQHWDVCPSARKEVNYFTALRHGEPLAPTSEYAAQFSACGTERYRMEASPGYAIGGTAVIHAVRRVLERPKVIIILRDPTERLWSAYTFQVARGQMKDVPSFEAFIAACERTRDAGRDGVPGNLFAALSMGFYAEYLAEWLASFGDDLRVTFAEDLSARPRASVEDLCRWLEIDVEAVNEFDLSRRNRTLRASSALLGRAGYLAKRATTPIRRYPAVRSTLRRAYDLLNRGDFHETLRPETREYLDRLHRPANLELAQLLKAQGYERLPEWLSVRPRA